VQKISEYYHRSNFIDGSLWAPDGLRESHQLAHQLYVSQFESCRLPFRAKSVSLACGGIARDFCGLVSGQRGTSRLRLQFGEVTGDFSRPVSARLIPVPGCNGDGDSIEVARRGAVRPRIDPVSGLPIIASDADQRPSMATAVTRQSADRPGGSRRRRGEDNPRWRP
jgi:hypothetical protein